jgi:hypothetical protein
MIKWSDPYPSHRPPDDHAPADSQVSVGSAHADVETKKGGAAAR